MSIQSTKEIFVFTQLPVDGDPSNSNSDNWIWVHCLTFPVPTLIKLQFSNKPYKWIRFAIGVVIGAESGTLSLREDDSSPNHELLDSNLDSLDQLPAITDLYYHLDVSNEQGGVTTTRRMFPLDPDFANTRNSSTNTSASHHVTFRAEVSQRDGNRCVLTEAELHCDAAHLVSHTKGDEYIENLTTRRPQGANDVVIHDIDDPRNGLFLNMNSRSALGKEFAILRTPNFAMETKDVIKVETEAANPGTTQAETEKTEDTTRYTAHLFNIKDKYNAALSGRPPGSSIRVPVADDDNNLAACWPPDVLFDAVYASAVSAYFGGPMKEIQRDLQLLEPFQKWYDPLIGPKTQQESERKQLDDEKRAWERKMALERLGSGDSNTDGADMDNMDVVFFLWHLSAGVSPKMVKKRREEMAVKEQEETAAKVEMWRESVPGTRDL